MDFNFYKHKNYRMLAIIPAVLIIAALLLIFFKGVPYGVELRGGLLVTVQYEGNVDPHTIEAATGGEVRLFDSPAGKVMEIELEKSPGLTKVEEALSALQADADKVREAEIRIASLEAQQADTPTDAGEASLRNARAEHEALNAALVSKVNENLAALKVTNSTPVTNGIAGVDLLADAFSKAQDDYSQDVLKVVREKVTVKSSSTRVVGPTLSKFFLQKARDILLYSFILAAIVVFIVFRDFVPSMAVIFGAFADIVMTVGGMSLFGIPLSLASIAGLLMLIGFSLDTDVMLTMRAIKRKEEAPAMRVYHAMQTGFMMNITSIAAFSVLAIIGTLLQVPTYAQLGLVVVIGSVADFAATWCANAVLVLDHIEKTEKGTGSA